MSDNWLKRVTVRPIDDASEVLQYQALMEQHHYLGWCKPVGARILYVAEVDGDWVALITWAAAALKVGARDRWLGGSLHTNPEKLRCIVNNTRFLVLPHARRPHLASRVLGLSCKRLCRDWIARYGYRALIAETFVDPRFSGTCYKAAGWHNLGLTRGWRRSSQGYSQHGIAKSIWVKELCYDARSLFLAPYPLSCFIPGGTMPAIDINALPISDLMEIIGEKLSDPRQAIGKRFRLDSVVTLIILGHLCGFPCIAHISEWAPKLSHKIRKKLKFGGLKVPSHTTLHRVSKMVDVNQFLDAAREFQSQKSGGLAGVGIAIDGKTIRGAKDNTGKAPHVLSAVRHDNRLPVAQITVPEKANEITALQPMIEKIELTGAMLTIDAMHTNNKTAEYITEVKQADYMLTLKDNQPTLLADVKRLFSEGAFSPLSHTEPATKAHGRIEYRHITVIPLEDGDTYLSNAEQVIKIERIREGVKTKTKTIEVAYCITSAEPEKYTPQQLLKFNRNHWGVEATHHIRDTTFQEDRSTKKLGAVFMAALRAFAIGLLNFLGFPDIARTARALRYAAIT